MPIPIEYAEIISTLAAKTAAGLVHWQADKYMSISVMFETTRFQLWAGNDEHSEEPFVAFGLQNEYGESLDSWYVEEHEGAPYVTMHELWKAANRRVKGLPDTLKKLREKLAAAEKIGAPETISPVKKR